MNECVCGSRACHHRTCFGSRRLPPTTQASLHDRRQTSCLFLDLGNLYTCAAKMWSHSVQDGAPSPKGHLSLPGPPCRLLARRRRRGFQLLALRGKAWKYLDVLKSKLRACRCYRRLATFGWQCFMNKSSFTLHFFMRKLKQLPWNGKKQ